MKVEGSKKKLIISEKTYYQNYHSLPRSPQASTVKVKRLHQPNEELHDFCMNKHFALQPIFFE